MSTDMAVDSTNCPDAASHTSGPRGYIQWATWAHNKAKTHRQIRCTGCGLYLVWVPKEQAIQSATGVK